MNNMKRLLVTIDGPAGAGKTTVSRRLADSLGYTYVDTGALYRAVALVVASKGCGEANDGEIEGLCRGLTFRFENSKAGPLLFVNDLNVTHRIRTPEITMLASALSAKSVVRESLLQVQRDLGREGGAVFEGRDMGTVVFPKADVKFLIYSALACVCAKSFCSNAVWLLIISFSSAVS